MKMPKILYAIGATFCVSSMVWGYIESSTLTFVMAFIATTLNLYALSEENEVKKDA